MSKLVKTPFQPDRGPLSEGLVIQVGTADMEPRHTLQMAQRVVRETLSGAWEVHPLNVATRDFEVKPAGNRTLSVARSWDLTAQLRQHRDVISAEPALIVPGIAPDPRQVFTPEELRQQPALPSDQILPCSENCEWSLTHVSIPEAWALPLPDHGFGRAWGEGIVIGHPDTGYTQHPEIADPTRLLTARGFDFEDSDADAQDPLMGMNPGHGTSTASVIMSASGSQAKAEFVSGTAPRAQLVPLRVSTSVVHLSFSRLTKALTYATENGHHIISMSLGGPLGADFLLRAIRDALAHGVIVLSAAGNIWPWIVYPAHYDEVIAVAACNCMHDIWSGSSAGPQVDVTAPGESVWCAFTVDSSDPFGVARSSGTSFAVATTAGVCALWLAYHGRNLLIQRYGVQNLASVFKEILIKYGVDTPTNWDNHKHGAGILNARKVLEAPLPDTAPSGGVSALHASPVARSTNDLDQLLEYFPSLDPIAVRQTLIELLRTDDRNLAILLNDFADELRFHIAVNPAVRSLIARKASGGLPAGTRLRAKLADNSRFTRHASKRLRQRVL